MRQTIEGKHLRKPRILVAPLDWGLGHATRCVPLIHELLAQGAEPILAAEGAQARLLQEEFPALALLPLEGYRVRYAKSRRGLLWKMLLQAPRILRMIKKEHAWLQKVVLEQDIDGVISDHRYGLHHTGIPTVFITHQLQIATPFSWTDRLIRRKNYGFINRFSECWVPDLAGTANLAGRLSHPDQLPAVPVHYIGPLSRFAATGTVPTKGHLLFVLSGPEPQRSILENMIIDQVAHYSGTATIVRALPGEQALIPSTNMIRFFNHLPAKMLNIEMEKAEVVISRSGYSTVMDIMQLQKKNILIPTPGQTEQEYLAAHLAKHQRSFCINQQLFDLEKTLHSMKTFSFEPVLATTGSLMKENVIRFLHTLPVR